MLRAEKIVDGAEGFEEADGLVQGWAEAESLDIAEVLIRCWAEAVDLEAEGIVAEAGALKT